ncbi:Acetyltransferase ataH [Colletotrichum sidae]|uniref:Acetyltransferase ataH n=1 Tax=Colletotrichum sidae TaxID=1347389 RepID=A0A4V3I4E9_9PEZI|nr:Acetyltransferase ataH [Colletotrichum sidae]
MPSFSHSLLSGKGKKYKPGQRSWHFAYHLSACSQYKGTRWQVRRQSDRPIETVTPPVLSSRATFIFCRLAKLACRYVALGILLDPAIYLRLPGPEAPYPVAADFEPPKRIFFRHFLPGYSTLSRSALKRATVLRLHWFFTASLLEYLMLSIGYDILVVLAVALHLDDPGQWDLYGNVMEVFTVRRYWSRWHHLIVYRPLVALAGKTVAGKTANCGGNIRRYIHNWLVFVTSGLMHSAVTFVMDPKKSLRCGYLGATKNYALQPLGMAIEAVFVRLWGLGERRAMSKLGHSGKRVYVVASRILGRALGRVWVFAFMTWAATFSHFSEEYCSIVSELSI